MQQCCIEDYFVYTGGHIVAQYIGMWPLGCTYRRPHFCKTVQYWSIATSRSIRSNKLALHFNGHFSCEPGLAGVYWSKRWWRWCWQLDYWSYKLSSLLGTVLCYIHSQLYIYIHCRIDDVHLSVADVERCVTAIGHWMSANRLKLNTDKMELIWTGTRSNLERIPGGGVSLALGNDVIPVAESVRVLGVVITPDKHVTAVSAKCFFELRQLRRVRRSLDIATLVHAFVTSQVDYCNCLLTGVTKASLDKLQHVTNAAARVVSDTHKCDRGLTSIHRNDLHWLDVPERVTFRICVMVYKCLHGMAPPYLSELCRQTRNIEGCRQLCSTTRGDLDVSRCRLSTYGRRAFSCAGPAAWNYLRGHLKNSTLTIEQFRRLLKYFLFSSH